MEPEVTNHGPRVPLFEGSQVAEDEALVALLSLASRHRLTYACMEDILRFVSSLLPMPNGLTISLYRLLGRFVNFSKETNVHKFCGNCSAVLQDGSKCTRPACLSVRQQDATFIEIPLQYQIQERMQGWLRLCTCKQHKFTNSQCSNIQSSLSMTWFSIASPETPHQESYKTCMMGNYIRMSMNFSHAKIIYL